MGNATRTIPVFGNRRGGTSAVAGVLRLLGVPMGAEVRDGNNEDARMQQAVRHGGPEGVRALVEEYDSLWDVWGWKFPKSIIRYHWIQPLLRNPTPICVYRPVDEILDAITRYDSWEGDRAAVNRIENRRRLFSQLDGLHIQYHDLLEDTEQTVGRIADYVGVEVADWPRIQAYVKPGYRTLDGEPVAHGKMREWT